MKLFFTTLWTLHKERLVTCFRMLIFLIITVFFFVKVSLTQNPVKKEQGSVVLGKNHGCLYFTHTLYFLYQHFQLFMATVYYFEIIKVFRPQRKPADVYL